MNNLRTRLFGCEAYSVSARRPYVEGHPGDPRRQKEWAQCVARGCEGELAWVKTPRFKLQAPGGWPPCGRGGWQGAGDQLVVLMLDAELLNDDGDPRGHRVQAVKSCGTLQLRLGSLDLVVIIGRDRGVDFLLEAGDIVEEPSRTNSTSSGVRILVISRSANAGFAGSSSSELDESSSELSSRRSPPRAAAERKIFAAA